MTPLPAQVAVPFAVRYSSALRVELRSLEAELWVEDASGVFKPVRMKVDCGTQLTRIPEPAAILHALPLASADPPITLTENTAGGTRQTRIRRGEIRLRFTPTEPAAPFVIPVQFVQAAGPVPPPMLLGLSDVVTQMTWHLDGRNAPGQPFGACVLADTR